MKCIKRTMIGEGKLKLLVREQLTDHTYLSRRVFISELI